ncbi:MAG: cell division protein FtsQ/DivIB [Rhodocyclaceae bacterium]|nr:cell division protein FtsQ/DivIB [Rhodocyclaceae bacterium]
MSKNARNSADLQTIKNSHKTSRKQTGLWGSPALIHLAADFLIATTSLALAWGVLVSLKQLPVFPLQEVVVTRLPEQVSRLQVEHLVNESVIGNFFTVDLIPLQTAAMKLPWVRQVEIRRRWPGTLELTFEPHVAVARWQPGKDARLVNEQGEIFQGTTELHLPGLFGPEGASAQLLTRYRDITTALAATSLQVRTITLSPRDAWQVQLSEGLIIELGRDQAKHPIMERINRLAMQYPIVQKTLGSSTGGVVDMRYPNGFVIRPRA